MTSAELPALELVLLGTGSPVPSANRSGACQGVLGGATALLVDCGWGATRRCFAAGLPPVRFAAIFFTHLHSDHITDLADFLIMRWTGGATSPLQVYGPEGTGAMVAGFRQAVEADTRYRFAHHGEKLAAAGTECEVHEISVGPAPAVVAEIGDITVQAFEVDHRPVFPAFGFRFERGGRSLVMSGDTNYCPGLVAGSQAADLLVCEGLHPQMMADYEANLRRVGAELAASLLEDAHTYHIPPEGAARIAQEAGVKHLVFSHILPPIADEGPAVEQFVAGLDAVFPGKITVGHDLQRFQI
jgi:ribonuclease Z